MGEHDAAAALTDLQLIDLRTLARLLGRAEETIKSDLRRAPWRAPPPIPARDWAEPRWQLAAVRSWIECPPPHPPRRQRRHADQSTASAEVEAVAAAVAAELSSGP